MEIGENFNPDELLKGVSDKDFSNVELHIVETERELIKLKDQLGGVMKELENMGYDASDRRADEAVLPFLKKDKFEKNQQDVDNENYYSSLIKEKNALEEGIEELKRDLDGLKSEL